MEEFVERLITISGGSRISRRGGRQPRRGGANSRGGYVSKIFYVKMKESGPLGGRAPAAPPGSATDHLIYEGNTVEDSVFSRCSQVLEICNFPDCSEITTIFLLLVPQTRIHKKKFCSQCFNLVFFLNEFGKFA